jgi:hypothetical protein
MSLIDPKKPPPIGPGFFLYAGVAFFLAVGLGGLLQDARWRGSFSGFAASPLESGDQQLKLAEVAFKDGNDAVALKLFDSLAAKNDANADYWLGHMTELGLGVPNDIPKAIALYEKSATQGSLAAETRLGQIYLNGNLTTPDYAKAFDLLGKAARDGNPRAAMSLGQMYRFGLATRADPVESYAWSEVAVLEGLGFAKIERDAAFASMPPADRDKGAARSASLLEDIKKLTSAPKKS